MGSIKRAVLVVCTVALLAPGLSAASSGPVDVLDKRQTPTSCSVALATPPPTGYACERQGSIGSPSTIATTTTTSQEICRDSCLNNQPTCVSFSYGPGKRCITYNNKVYNQRFRAGNTGMTFWNRHCYKKTCGICPTDQPVCGKLCCRSDQVCSGGQCTCQSGQRDCNGQCVDEVVLTSFLLQNTKQGVSNGYYFRDGGNTQVDYVADASQATRWVLDTRVNNVASIANLTLDNGRYFTGQRSAIGNVGLFGRGDPIQSFYTCSIDVISQELLCTHFSASLFFNCEGLGLLSNLLFSDQETIDQDYSSFCTGPLTVTAQDIQVFSLPQC